MVIRVNGETASAAEVVAGALQAHKRATVVGSKTFGKGVVQDIEKLPGGGGTQITTSEYELLNGPINEIGVIPDVFAPDVRKELQAQKSEMIDEDALRAIADETYIAKEKTFDPQELAIEDYSLYVAYEVLKERMVFSQ